jgi:hypothetical protein
MKYVHWVAYPTLILIIVGLFASSIEPAIRLDHMQQAQLDDQRAIGDLLRYISVNSNCDTTPQQLSRSMGKGYDLIHSDKGNPEVAHLAFRAKYEGNSLWRSRSSTVAGSLRAAVSGQFND